MGTFFAKAADDAGGIPDRTRHKVWGAHDRYKP